MTATVSQEIELCGVYLEVEADFDVDWVDNGIGSYEFWGAKGVHHDYGWEVQECEGMSIISDIKEAVIEAMHDRGITNHNRRFKKRVRQWVRKIEASFAKMDDSQIFDDEQICEAAGDAPDYEPDYDEDREPMYD